MTKEINKIIIIVAVAAVCAGIGTGGYFYWKNLQKSKANNEIKSLDAAENTAAKITESATQGTLPSIGTNPLENKPNINPVDNANPFKNIKTNPFE